MDSVREFMFHTELFIKLAGSEELTQEPTLNDRETAFGTLGTLDFSLQLLNGDLNTWKWYGTSFLQPINNQSRTFTYWNVFGQDGTNI